MAYVDVHVDPSIAGDSGTGTLIDPYGDLQYAFDNESHNTTLGTRFNVKEGTDEILTGGLDLTTYGTSTFTDHAPLVIQGYETAPGDHGRGAINGNALYGMMASNAADYVLLVDMELYNTGSNKIIDLDNSCSMIFCEIHGSTSLAVDCDSSLNLYGCLIYDVGDHAVDAYYANILYNVILDGPTNHFADYAISLTSASHSNCVVGNIVKCNGTGQTGIVLSGGICAYNSVYNAAAGTQYGIHCYYETILIANNLVEGWNGVGGYGFYTGGRGPDCMMNNAAYNNTTNYATACEGRSLHIGNEVLTASPYSSLTTFEPSDEGSIRATDGSDGAWPMTHLGGNVIPYLDKGAVQGSPSAGGGGPGPRIALPAGLSGRLWRS